MKQSESQMLDKDQTEIETSYNMLIGEYMFVRRENGPFVIKSINLFTFCM